MEINPAEKVEELLEQLELRNVHRRRTVRQRLRLVPLELLYDAMGETFLLAILDGSSEAYRLLQLLLDELADRGHAGADPDVPGEAPEA